MTVSVDGVKTKSVIEMIFVIPDGTGSVGCAVTEPPVEEQPETTVKRTRSAAHAETDAIRYQDIIVTKLWYEMIKTIFCSVLFCGSALEG